MPGWAVALTIVPIILMMDAAVVTVIMRAGWGELTQGFPVAEIAPGAVRRDYQSFKAGMYNFGWCVHVAVDENFLHLMPARIVRWCGGKPASIPWEQITFVFRKRSLTKVRIKSANITGPSWCLELASPGETPDPA